MKATLRRSAHVGGAVMNFVALKTHTGDPAKYLGLIFTIAFSSFVLANQTSIFAGILAHTGRQIIDVADADYVTRVNTAYSGGLIPANVLDALASFERSLLTPNARFDRYLRGELQALTAPEQQGYRLFKSYGCVACHQGIDTGGNIYQKFGIFEGTGGGGSPAARIDLGRYAVTKVARDRDW